jgi:enoyl-CoA hydratase/carnithine racemase
LADTLDEPAVRTEKADKVGWIILNRPNQINAMNRALRLGYVGALHAFDDDPEVSVIVIRGEGPRGFCAGADIKEQRNADSLTELRKDLLFSPGIETVDKIRKPVIAAVHGFCMGGGMELAMACDIRVASPDAVFSLPEVGLGLIPGAGGTQRLSRLVGLGRALDLLLSGDRFDAAEAYRIGLVSRLSASTETLVEEVGALARKIAGKPQSAAAYAKEAARSGMDLSLNDGLRLEKDLFTVLMSTEDRKEAAAAFKEKRAPNFTGR